MGKCIIFALFAGLMATSAAAAELPTISITAASPGRVALRITGTIGKSYVLQAAIHPRGPWVRVFSGQFDGGAVTLLDRTDGYRFYRVEQET